MGWNNKEEVIEEVKTEEFIKYFEEKKLKEEFENDLCLTDESLIDIKDLEGAFNGTK